jgi:hypothetical protein
MECAQTRGSRMQPCAGAFVLTTVCRLQKSRYTAQLYEGKGDDRVREDAYM